MKNKIFLALATIVANIIVWLVPVPEWFKVLFLMMSVYYAANILSKDGSLFKKIFICIFIFLILSWIVPTGTLSTNTITVSEQASKLGIWNLFNIFSVSISSFAIYGLFLMAVGAFYLMLNNTGAYQRIVEKIAKKARKKPVLFVSIVTVIFAVLSSVTNIGLMLFILVPFFSLIIYKMGYDKFVAASATIGGVIVGIIGSTLGYYVTYIINTTLSLDLEDNIIFKIALLVLGTLLLLLNTKHHMKANKSNKLDENIEREDTLYMELEGKSIKKRKSLPLIIIMILILILTLISTYSWTSMFELSIFTDFHNKVSELPVLMDILGKPMTIGYYSQYGVNAFGSWDYIDLSIVLVLASLLIALIYRVDIKKIAKSFTDSVRKFIRPTFYILLAYTLFVLNYYVPVFTSIISYFGNDFNIITSSVVAFLSSIINIDMMYVAQGSLAISNAVISNTSVAPILGVLYQAIFGLSQLIVPTSVLLIVLLCYFKISYKEWFKYIWKLVLELLILILVVLIVMMLI